MKILLATKNLGKLKEMKEIFLQSTLKDVEFVTLNDFETVEEPVEDGLTFYENAYIKVMYYYNKFKIPTICDDTGLCVDYLNGAPGVYTARFAPTVDGKQDSNANMNKLLSLLEGVKNRKAHFECVMYYYDGNILISSNGVFNGSIATKKIGDNGFGYDPIFYVDKYQCTVGELDSKIKNEISHRSLASKMLVKQLESRENKF